MLKLTVAAMLSSTLALMPLVTEPRWELQPLSARVLDLSPPAMPDPTDSAGVLVDVRPPCNPAPVPRPAFTNAADAVGEQERTQPRYRRSDVVARPAFQSASSTLDNGTNTRVESEPLREPVSGLVRVLAGSGRHRVHVFPEPER